MTPPTYAQLRAHMESLGHVWFTGPWNVNMVGIRSRERTAGGWDDLLIMAYEDDDGQGWLYAYPGTTDPSDRWLKSEGRSRRGTAIVVPGQYRGMWKVGPEQKHRGKYPAFRQVGPVDYVRDDNGDAFLDVDALVAAGEVRSGLIGINGHRASSVHAVSEVGAYSAGCQVWRLWTDFQHALGFVTRAAERYGPTVTYTLLDEW